MTPCDLYACPSARTLGRRQDETEALRAERDRLRADAEFWKARAEKLEAGLLQMQADICANADDTLWIGPAETVVDRILSLRGKQEVDP